MKVTTKGQVTIPLPIRNYLGITASTEVDFVVDDHRVVLVTKTSQAKKSKFSKVVGILKGGWTTDEVMKLTRS
jgi:antitoxin PrlF